MRKILLILSLLLIATSEAATIPALGVSRDEIQAAVDSAVDGDIVILPEGTATFSVSSVRINGKGIQIIGAGWGKTVLIDNLPQSSGQATSSMFYWTTQSGEVCRISNIEFQGGARTANNTTGILYFNGTSSLVRIDRIKITGVRNRGVQIRGSVFGVGDQNWIAPFQGQSIYCEHETLFGKSNGDGSWENPVVPGSADAFYWEDNVIIDKSTDACGGARQVYRFNNFTNIWVGAHGTESTQNKRGARWTEVYGNIFHNPSSSRDKWLEHRDGGFLACSNIVTGNYSGNIKMNNYRRFASFVLWRGADGTNDWDMNDPVVYESGTATGGASLQMTDSTKTWTVNQWRGYAIKNKTTGRFSIVNSNTGNTLTFESANSFAANMTFTAGDEYELRWVIQTIDQNGLGQSDVIDRNNPSWLNQPTETIYQWANTRNGVTVTMGSGIYVNIVEGLHFTNNVPHPTWTPYDYPHPVRIATEGGAPDPFITVQPQSQTITIGQTANLSVTASGTATITYQWYQGATGDDSNPIGGATSSSYTTPALTETTSYWVRVENGLGTMDSSTAIVTVTGDPPIIVTQPQSETIAAGESASLSVEATGLGELTYQWYRGTSPSTANPESGATNATFTPSPSSTTSYWVRVTNAYGTADSATATVTVTTTAPPIISGSGARNPRSKIYWRRR